MPSLLWAALALAFGYVLGCIPMAWLVVRRRHGVDLRDLGSTGALGAFRAGGVRTALLALLLEAIKGGFVGLVVRIAGGPGWLSALAIAGCVAGDVFPLFLGRGGRGIVPLVSGLVVALPTAGLVTAVVAVAAIAVSRDRGGLAAGAVAVAVPVGLVVGTDDWRSLFAAALIVAVLLLRARLRPRRLAVRRVLPESRA